MFLRFSSPAAYISLKDLCTFLGFQPIELHKSGNDAANTLVVLSILASKIQRNNAHGNDTYGVPEGIIQAALMSDKTAKQRRKETEQEELLKIGHRILTSRTCSLFVRASFTVWPHNSGR